MRRLAQAISQLCLVTVCCLSLAGPAFGQATGTILGTVKDTSGAVVVGAKITLVNEGTGVTRSVTADPTGSFLIPRLPVGSYTARAEQAGFRTFENRGILLQVDQSVTLAIMLDVGEVATEVTVQGAATLLQTNTSTLSQVVERKRVEDLPLNGRNVLQLIRLNAGIVNRGIGTYSQFQIAGGGYGSPNSVNGTRGNQTTFLLDGGNNTNGIINSANPFPNPDAVQEFSVQTNNFSAEFGNVGGGVVNVVTKSGTNSLHGSLYEFYRDGRLNARSFFATQQDALKRHQFGATAGGPVLLPKLYNGRNRTFFFAAYQGTRNREVITSSRITGFTAAQKTGDLSSITTPVRDPLTNTPFAGNIIPQNRFDPVSAKFLELMPSANVTGTNFFTFVAPKDRRDEGQYTGRLDHQLTSKDQLTARWFQFGYVRDPALNPGNLYSARGGERSQAKNIHVSHTRIFSSSLLNVAKYTYNYQRADPASALNLAPSDFGSRMVRGNPTAHFSLAIAGYNSVSPSFVGRNFNKSHEFADTISYSSGRHNLRFGYQYLRDYKFASNDFNNSGTFTFSGQRAGHALGDFLLGLPVSLGIRNVAVSDTVANYHGLFVHDDWRVTRTLTLNFGLRWDGVEPYIDRRGFQPYFRPGQRSTVFPRAPLGALFPGDAGVPESDSDRRYARPADPDRNNLAPRFGLAWNPTPKLVIRAAYGIFYSHATAQITAVAAEPWVRLTNLDNPPSFSNPFGNGQPVNPNVNEAATDFVFSAAPALSVMDPDFKMGIIQTMNFGFERQLATDLMVRAMYVGTIGQHLEIGRELNAAVYSPTATTGNINARRPYAGIGNIRNTESNGRSWYHSMQLSATRRFSKGLSFQVNYTLSKSIDDTSILISPGNSIGPDPSNRRLNQGPSDFDATHTLVASGIWEIPAPKTGSAVLRQIVNGWQLNPIISVQSGVPFTPFDSRDLALAGIGNGIRLLTNGDITLSTSRPRGDQIARYFNTTAFSLPAAGSFGASGRNILRGPGEASVDFSVFKSFFLFERARIQFRSEFFNLFNRPAFGNPINTFNSPNFGQITTAGPGRVVQFGLRLTL
ncbi:MAG: TonB-dependent receptor domain-containing protein [Bryobacteraceae bacterium]